MAWPEPQSHRSEEHTSELQSHVNLVCRLLLEKKKIDAAIYEFGGNDSSELLRLLSQHPNVASIIKASRSSADQPFAEVFFFNDTAATEIYTLSLHDALPISVPTRRTRRRRGDDRARRGGRGRAQGRDRKSTRLNSSHMSISYAVFCLKK